MEQRVRASNAAWLLGNWRWLALVAVLFALATVPEAAARAGGGGSFHSGGGGGGSGGGGFHGGYSRSYGGSYHGYSGSGGGGGPVWPAILTLALFGAFIGLTKLNEGVLEPELKGREIQHRKREADQLSRNQGIKRIRDTDAGFSEEKFLLRVRDAFVRVQQAWRDRDMRPVCHFLSDGVYERFALQLEEMKEQGTRNVMEQVEVLHGDVAQAEVYNHFQTITVRIHASAIDYTLDGTGKQIGGSRAPERFSEYWSFVRRPGAQTKAGKGLFEGNCPNCGCRLKLNQVAKCESCGAQVRNGRYDWVLTEITQESEWQPTHHSKVPGASAMAKADRSFCLQQLEDRASVIFWRYIAARRQGKTDPLRKMASDAYCRGLARGFTPEPDGSRLVPTEAAVGSVETAGILCGEPTDRAILEIHWSCGQERLSADGSRRPHTSAAFHSCHFVLGRKHGTVSDADNALSSSHCPNCGAPDTQNTADTCEYCGEPLRQGDRDWVLEDIHFRHSPAARELLGRICRADSAGAPAKEEPDELPPPPVKGKELLAWLVHAMLADGKVDKQEERLLHAYAKRHGVRNEQLSQLIAAKRAGELHVEAPRNSNEARQRLQGMARMVLADGFVSEEEKQTMLSMGKFLGFTKRDVESILRKTRRRLAAAHRNRLKKRRG